MPVAHLKSGDLAYSYRPADNSRISLVLVHGAGGQQHDWPSEWRSRNDATKILRVIKEDDGRRRMEGVDVYAIDLPAHGDSTGEPAASIEELANVVAAFLDELDLKNVVIAGHSMGGAIALTLAARRHERLVGQIIVGSAAKIPVTDKILDGLQDEFEATVDFIIKYSWHRQTAGFIRETARNRILAAGSKVVHRDFLACSTFDLSDRAGDISLPTLVIAGEKDKMVPPERCKALCDAIAGSRLEVVPECGHFLHIEKAAAVSDLIRGFCNELAVAG